MRQNTSFPPPSPLPSLHNQFSGLKRCERVREEGRNRDLEWSKSIQCVYDISAPLVMKWRTLLSEHKGIENRNWMTIRSDAELFHHSFRNQHLFHIAARIAPETSDEAIYLYYNCGVSNWYVFMKWERHRIKVVKFGQQYIPAFHTTSLFTF